MYIRITVYPHWLINQLIMRDGLQYVDMIWLPTFFFSPYLPKLICGVKQYIGMYIGYAF